MNLRPFTHTNREHIWHQHTMCIYPVKSIYLMPHHTTQCRRQLQQQSYLCNHLKLITLDSSPRTKKLFIHSFSSRIDVSICVSIYLRPFTDTKWRYTWHRRNLCTTNFVYLMSIMWCRCPWREWWFPWVRRMYIGGETLQQLAHKDHDAGPVGTQKNVVAAHSKDDNAWTIDRLY